MTNKQEFTFAAVQRLPYRWFNSFGEMHKTEAEASTAEPGATYRSTVKAEASSFSECSRTLHCYLPRSSQHSKHCVYCLRAHIKWIIT